MEEPGSPSLIIIGPTPPPTHGVSIMVEYLLQSLVSQAQPFVHINTSDGRGLEHVGRPDAYDVLLFAKQWLALLRGVIRQRSVVYLPISQTTIGVFRDGLFLMIPFILGVPYLCHLHGGDFGRWLAGSPNWMQRWVRLLLRRAEATIVLDASFRVIFDGLVSPDRVAVIPNGVPDPNERRWPAATEATGLEVVYIGFLSPGKGIDVMLAAAAEVLRKHPTATFTLAGAWPAGKFRQQVEAMRALVEDPQRIRLVGPVEQEAKRQLLSRATIFVFPGVQQEGQPLVLLEAMSHGLPIVCTDTGCVAATVGSEAALIAKRGDPKDLADKICCFLGDPVRRKEAGLAARARYQEQYGLQRHLQEMSAVLLAAASSRRPKPLLPACDSLHEVQLRRARAVYNNCLRIRCRLRSRLFRSRF